MAKLETRAKGQFGSINSMHRFDAVSDDEDTDDRDYNVKLLRINLMSNRNNISIKKIFHLH